MSRRAPVQENRDLGKGAGTIAWVEHEQAWIAYDAKWHSGQTAARIAERGGFCYGELVEFLGSKPETWRPK